MTGLGLAGALLLALVLWPSHAGAQAADACAACHLETGDERLAAPARSFDGDVHKAKGFGCVDCHGGDSRATGMEAMDPRKGFIGKPSHQQVIQVCGRCHSDASFMKRYNPSLRVDQVAEYATSVHGRRLRELGDPKVATCASCHPAHSIRPPSDPQSSVYPLHVADTCGRCHADGKYMASYKIPTDQVEKYKTSVHWAAMTAKGDLSAPTCNDCHGNHGAVPPGVGWVGNVCGQCHTVQGDLFRASVHARAFAQMGTPGCATCHENHAIHPPGDFMLGLGDKAVCSSCHGPDDKGGKSAVEMQARITSLRTELEKADALLGRAERAGMEVSQAQFDLNGARDDLIKARAAVHAFKVDAVTQAVEPGLTVSAKAHARGLRALEELGFRRKGLAVSLLVIFALIVGLVVKIRQLDRRVEASHD
jgi:transposase-like protein